MAVQHGTAVESLTINVLLSPSFLDLFTTVESFAAINKSKFSSWREREIDLAANYSPLWKALLPLTIHLTDSLNRRFMLKENRVLLRLPNRSCLLLYQAQGLVAVAREVAKATFSDSVT